MLSKRPRAAPRPAARAFLRRSSRFHAILSGVLVLAVIAVAIGDLRARYFSAIANAERSSRNFAEVLAEHTARSFEAADRTIRAAAAVYAEHGEELLRSGAAAHEALRRLNEGAPVIQGIGWIDADGNLTASSLSSSPPTLNVADRPHFTVQRDRRDVGLFLGEPTMSPVRHAWIVPATRRVERADGSFAGTVVALIDPAYFAKIYSTIDLGPGRSVVLAYRDGVILTREPHAELAIGRSLASPAVLREMLAKSETGVREAISNIDGVDRLIGYKAVAGLPLVVMVSVDRRDVLESWWGDVRTFGPGAVVFVVVVVLSTWFAVRQTTAAEGAHRRLEAVTANFPGTIFRRIRRTDGSGVFTYVSPGVTRMLNVQPERLVGRSDGEDDFLHPDERADYRRLWTAASRTLTPFTHDLRVIDAQGAGKWLRLAARPSPGEKGQIVWDGIALDITEQKRGEEAVHRSEARALAAEARLRDAVTSIADGFILWDAENRLVLCNDQVASIFGIDPQLMVPGARFEDLIRRSIIGGNPIIGKLDVEEAVRRRIAMIGDLGAGFERRLRDGRSFLVSEKRIKDGGFVTLFTEISELKQAERALKSERQLLDAIESISEGFILFDRDDKIVLTNSKFREMFAIVADILKPGTTYETMLRVGVERGVFQLDVEPEAWIERAMAWHRAAAVVIERQLGDGRWCARPSGGRATAESSASAPISLPSRRRRRRW